MRPETLSDIVGSVYDCVLEPHEWSRTLPLISDFGESAASSIVVQDRLSSSGTSIFEHGADQSYLRLYFEKLVASRLPPMKQVTFDSVGDVATMTMLAGEREPLNSDFYVKWVKPLGFRDVIGVLVNGHHPDRRSGAHFLYEQLGGVFLESRHRIEIQGWPAGCGSGRRA
jgi:hypothetical protein